MILISPDGKLITKLDKFDQFTIQTHSEKYHSEKMTYSISGATFNPTSTMFDIQGEWIPIVYFDSYEKANKIFEILKEKLASGSECFDIQEYLKLNSF